jgi:hypothetical protein
MTFDACALRKMSRSGASCRTMWVAAPQQVTWVRQGHTTETLSRLPVVHASVGFFAVFLAICHELTNDGPQDRKPVAGYIYPSLLRFPEREPVSVLGIATKPHAGRRERPEPII